MDDHTGAHLADERQDPGPVADVELVVDEAFDLGGEAALIPACVALGAEEHRALVVVDAVHRVAQLAGEVGADLGADQARGAGNEETFGHKGDFI